MKAVILSGGKATRLRPLTCNTPKIMVPVLNRPFLAHLVDYLKRHQVTDLILAMGEVPEQVRAYLGVGGGLGVEIAYSSEQSPLGTAGAVKNTEELLRETFVVFNGDIFTDIDLTGMIEWHRRKGAIATIALTPVDDPTVYGVVETDAKDRVRRFTEKPSRDEVTTNMINAGIYVLEPSILTCIRPGVFTMFERDVFPLLLERGEAIYGFASRDYWIDIGTPESYFKLNEDLLHRHIGAKGLRVERQCSVQPSVRIDGPVLIGEGSCVGDGCVLLGPSILGKGCRIDEGALVQRSLLWDDCTVGDGARVRNCLLSSCCRVGRGSALDSCILGDKVTIGANNELPQGVRIWPGKCIDDHAISFQPWSNQEAAKKQGILDVE